MRSNFCFNVEAITKKDFAVLQSKTESSKMSGAGRKGEKSNDK